MRRPGIACVGRLALLAAIAPWLTGCPFPPPDGGDGGELPFLDVDGNFTFDSATTLPLAPSDRIEFAGEISGEVDADIFDLGTLSAGDRLFIDVQRTSGDLDAVAAVFDAAGNLLFFNDDRVLDASDLNPLIDEVIRGDTGAYFLGIAALSGSQTTGGYRVTVRVTRGVGVPPPTGQIVYLNWRGGQDIVVQNVGTFDLTPFDASDLGAAFEGATARIKDLVERFVREAYRGFDLTLLSSDDQAEPLEPHTTIHFGGNSQRAFAISQQIDTFNADPQDDAIVFTRAYRTAFAGTPTVEGIAQALGNTVAHEIGHLLGLVHTADCDELMDSTCGNGRLLEPQQFGTATLDDSVFPIGQQNALELLAWTLGLVGG